MKYLTVLSALCFLHFVGISLSATNKGHISYLKGTAYIERGSMRMPAQIASSITAGDIISTEENAYVTIELFDTGVFKISGKSRFRIPDTDTKSVRTSTIQLLFGNIWSRARKLLNGETFEIKTPTATAGVRGTVFGVEYIKEQQTTKTFVESGEVYSKDLRGRILNLQRGMVAEISKTNMHSRVDRQQIARKRLQFAYIPDDGSNHAKEKAEKLSREAQNELNQIKLWESKPEIEKKQYKIMPVSPSRLLTPKNQGSSKNSNTGHNILEGLKKNSQSLNRIQSTQIQNLKNRDLLQKINNLRDKELSSNPLTGRFSSSGVNPAEILRQNRENRTLPLELQRYLSERQRNLLRAAENEKNSQNFKQPQLPEAYRIYLPSQTADENNNTPTFQEITNFRKMTEEQRRYYLNLRQQQRQDTTLPSLPTLSDYTDK